jgi:hypothetical protein
VKRYETDRLFAMALLKAVGCNNVTPVGTAPEIRTTLKAGEYLSEEVRETAHRSSQHTGKACLRFSERRVWHS